VKEAEEEEKHSLVIDDHNVAMSGAQAVREVFIGSERL
jgi:hypothetical protein